MLMFAPQGSGPLMWFFLQTTANEKVSDLASVKQKTNFNFFPADNDFKEY